MSFSARHRKNCSITSLHQLVHISSQSFDLIVQRREFLLDHRQHGRNVRLGVRIRSLSWPSIEMIFMFDIGGYPCQSARNGS